MLNNTSEVDVHQSIVPASTAKQIGMALIARKEDAQRHMSVRGRYQGSHTRYRSPGLEWFKKLNIAESADLDPKDTVSGTSM